jgi:hypothetical protein
MVASLPVLVRPLAAGGGDREERATGVHNGAESLAKEVLVHDVRVQRGDVFQGYRHPAVLGIQAAAAAREGWSRGAGAPDDSGTMAIVSRISLRDASAPSERRPLLRDGGRTIPRSNAAHRRPPVLMLKQYSLH